VNVELDADEVWSLFSTVMKDVVDQVDFADEDRAALRRWRSEKMRPGSDDLKSLLARVNGDIARLTKSKERSQIQKHDWV
jgi:hypothetical protein